VCRRCEVRGRSPHHRPGQPRPPLSTFCFGDLRRPILGTSVRSSGRSTHLFPTSHCVCERLCVSTCACAFKNREAPEQMFVSPPGGSECVQPDAGAQRLGSGGFCPLTHPAAPRSELRGSFQTSTKGKLLMQRARPAGASVGNLTVDLKAFFLCPSIQPGFFKSPPPPLPPQKDNLFRLGLNI